MLKKLVSFKFNILIKAITSNKQKYHVNTTRILGKEAHFHIKSITMKAYLVTIEWDGSYSKILEKMAKLSRVFDKCYSFFQVHGSQT